MNNRVTRKVCGAAAIPKVKEGRHQNISNIGQDGYMERKKSAQYSD